MTDRRSFLKLTSGAIAWASVGPHATLSPAWSPESAVVAARLVPDGAECRAAFVADHHYWPDHAENWGGGAQITSSTNRRMPDLTEALNAEGLDLSIHGGDVISAGGSFFPPPEEYARQLAFAKRLYEGLNHPSVPLIGNHETLEASVTTEGHFEPWVQHFGAPYRYLDVRGWRFVGLNCLLPNPNGRHGKGDSYGNVYGLDDVQLHWLRTVLRDAADRGLKALAFAHVPPGQWLNPQNLEKAIVEAGCVRAVLCGHAHRNSRQSLGDVPLYSDGRIVVVQRSQHFPFEDFVSSRLQPGPQGTESDRYLTLGGDSRLPLDGLRVAGEGAEAAIVDGHLRLSSANGRAIVLIDKPTIRNARLSLTAVKASGDRMGAVALTGAGGTGGIEAALTSRYSSDGKVYIARSGTERDVLARSWFNVADDIAYRLVLDVRDGQVTTSWKNMVSLSARVNPSVSGHFGFFVERGTAYVTDLRLERT
jgi:hypothetical protein